MVILDIYRTGVARCRSGRRSRATQSWNRAPKRSLCRGVLVMRGPRHHCEWNPLGSEFNLALRARRLE